MTNIDIIRDYVLLIGKNVFLKFLNFYIFRKVRHTVY